MNECTEQMADFQRLASEDRAFLDAYLPNADASNRSLSTYSFPRPFVTLTYACSLDSMISLAPGVQTTLSGPETKSMTHYLRRHHDAILVGVGTAIADDPSLNCRYPGVNMLSQPRPVIVDPNARWNISNSKVVTLAKNERGKIPWVVHSSQTEAAINSPSSDYERVLIDGPRTEHGTSMTENPTSSLPKLKWISLLRTLKERGIHSVMIEGGATIINELLSQPHIVDSVIVTIAPTWLGAGGVQVSPVSRTQQGKQVNAARLANTHWRQFGSDVVLCGTFGG